MLYIEVSNCWKIVEFQNISIKIKKKCKSFCEVQTFSRLQSPPSPSPPNKILLRLWNKNFLTEIYRHKDIQKYTDRKAVLGIQKWCNTNIFCFILFFVCCCCCCCCCCFLTQQKEICKLCNVRKFLNSERFLAVWREDVIPNAKRVEIRKMSENFFSKTVL